jgi:hypothetical protein
MRHLDKGIVLLLVIVLARAFHYLWSAFHFVPTCLKVQTKRFFRRMRSIQAQSKGEIVSTTLESFFHYHFEQIMSKKTVFAMRCALFCMILGLAVESQCASLELAGSPTFDPVAKSGFNAVPLLTSGISCWVNNSGVAVGVETKYEGGTSKGPCAVRWDTSGTSATELGNLGASASNSTSTYVYAVNNGSIAVGTAAKYVDGADKGTRAVRWAASGSSATELGNLGVDSSGCTKATAYALNNAGVVVGYAIKYIDGVDKGMHAVRWDASGNATELGYLGADNSSSARALNNLGIVVGYVNTPKGSRAVRWDESGNVTELANLGVSISGYTSATAIAVNDAGTALGYADKYVNGVSKGKFAVRWNATGTAITELGNLGFDNNGIATSMPYALNSEDIAVGYAYKYFSGGRSSRVAVRWDASGNITELGSLGVITFQNSYALALNSKSVAVGFTQKYLNNTFTPRAAIWLQDASVIDLNDLGIVPVPAGGTWTLTSAEAISEDGFVMGEGSFDPDGSGPLASYNRFWVAQVGLGGNWTKAADGVWGRGPNWSTGTPAMQVGQATFNLPGHYSVALDRNERTKSVAVQAGAVTLDLKEFSLSTESGLAISREATLETAGTIHGNLLNDGDLAISSNSGTLTLDGNLTNLGTLSLDISAPSLFDKLNVDGTFSAGGTIAIALYGGYRPAAGYRFDVIDFGGFTNDGYTFDFSAASLPAGYSWDISSFATDGSVAVVPEPSSLLLLGLLSFTFFGWKRIVKR